MQMYSLLRCYLMTCDGNERRKTIIYHEVYSNLRSVLKCDLYMPHCSIQHVRLEYALKTQYNLDRMQYSLVRHRTYRFDRNSSMSLSTSTEIAMKRAAEMYSSLHDAFSEEADDFLGEMEKILSALEAAMRFAEEWRASRINPEIDNT